MLTLVYTNLIKLAQIVTVFIGVSQKISVCHHMPLTSLVVSGVWESFQALHIDQLEGFRVL